MTKTKIKGSIFFTGITQFDLKTLTNITSKKSSDPHQLIMEILKHVMTNIAKPLTYICNKSFLKGFPDSMKILKIVQIFKAGEKIQCTIIDQSQYFHNEKNYLNRSYLVQIIFP